MNKSAAVRAIIEATTVEPIVFTTGYASRIARGIADRPGHFYMTGSMGLASSIGIGIAQQTGRPTVVVDGDGSLLMNPVGLVTAGGLGNLPLLHIVLDDGRYASTGGQAVPSNDVDLNALALACGYRSVRTVADIESLRAAIGDLLPGIDSPTFVHCVLRSADPPVSARVDGRLDHYAVRLREHIRERVLVPSGDTTTG